MTRNYRKPHKEVISNQEKELESQNEMATVTIGSKIVVGAPSSSFYQYVFETMFFEKHSLSQLQELLQIQDSNLEITGFLEMKTGEIIAVAKEIAENDNMIGFNRLFISLKNALRTKEILIKNNIEVKDNDND